jgi:exopolysaccharide biosynthesis predicted pyruvyltransferase EpsI
MRHLRVCWRNYEGAFNCGRCEKCLRTKAELAANDALQECLTFEGGLDLDALRAVDMSFGRHLSYGRWARDRARQNGNDALAEALSEAIARAEATKAAQRVGLDMGAAASSDLLVPMVAEHRDVLYSLLSAHHGKWLVARVMRDLPGKLSRKARAVLTRPTPRARIRSADVDTEPLATSGYDGVFVANPGGNLGDDLIAEACVAFLREAGLNIIESNGSLEAAAARNDSAYLSAALGRFTGVVYFAGGGNIGIYPDNAHRRRVIIEHAARARRFLVMPQSCAAPEPALRDDRVEVWAREMASLQMLQTAKIDTRLVPDAVFALGDRIAESPGGKGAISVLRTPGTCHERVEHGFNLPSPAADPMFKGTLPEAMATIAPFGTVLSDRLHGGILASMMRKRVGFLPVGYHKIRSFYDTWFADDPGVAFVETAEQVRQFLTDDTRSQLRHREVFMEWATPALQEFLDELARH